jgi:hypothetical protein
VNLGPFSRGTISAGRIADIAVDSGTYRLRAYTGSAAFYSEVFIIDVVASLPIGTPVIDDITITSVVTKRIKFDILDGVVDTNEDYSSLEIIDSAGASYGPGDQFVDTTSGMWKISPNGMSIQFVPFYGFIGVAEISWRISDLTGFYSTVKTITCTVAEVGTNYLNFVFGPTLMANTTEEQRANIRRSEKFFNYILRFETNSFQESIYGGSTNGLIVQIDVVPPGSISSGAHVLAESEAVQSRNAAERYKPYSGSIEINSAHLEEIFSMPTYYIDRMIVHGVIHILGFSAQMMLNQGVVLSIPSLGSSSFDVAMFDQSAFDGLGGNANEGFALSGGPLNEVFTQWNIESAPSGGPLRTDSSHWTMNPPGDKEIMFPTFGPNIIPAVSSWTLALLKDFGYNIDPADMTDHRYGQPGWIPFEGDEPSTKIFTMSMSPMSSPQPILSNGDAIIEDPDVQNLRCGCGS